MFRIKDFARKLEQLEIDGLISRLSAVQQIEGNPIRQHNMERAGMKVAYTKFIYRG